MIDPWEGVDPHGKLRDVLRQQARIADMTRGLAWASDLSNTLTALGPQLQKQLDFLGKVRFPEDLGRRIQDAWEAGLAENWRALHDDEVFAAVNLMMKEGLNVAWAPRADIVTLLVHAADEAEREAVLVARSADVFDDLTASLTAISRAALAPTVDAVHEAIANVRDGRHRSCTALIAVVLTGIVQGPLGHKEFSDARKCYENLDPERAGLPEYRQQAVYRCLYRAILRTKDWSGSGFNRHAVAHDLDAGQYTHANALAALLLVTGVLRELDLSAQSDVETPDAA